MTIKLLISDPDPLFYREVKGEFSSISIFDVIKGPSQAEELAVQIAKSLPDILILGPGWDESVLLKIVTDAGKDRPDMSIIAALAGNEQLSKKVLAAGAKETVLVPIESAKLLQTIQKCLKKDAKSKPEATKRGGKIITVFSTKGGVGKTVVAINLAVGIPESKRSDVIVLDLDLQFGDVGVMLKLSPKYTIYDLVASGNKIDKTHVKSLLTEYSPNINTLMAPLQPELADLIMPKTVNPTLKALSELADYVIVDTPPSFNDNVLSVLDQSDNVLLISTMDLPSIKNIKLCLQTMKLLGYPEEKVKLVLNRVEKGIGLSVEEIESSLKTRVCQTIPNDKTVLLSVNKGTPVLVEAPKSPAGLCLSKLAEMFINSDDKALLSA